MGKSDDSHQRESKRQADIVTAATSGRDETLKEDQAETTVHAPGYSVLRELARGGQATVYVAVQQSTGRRIALKVLRDTPFSSERTLLRFQREVQVLAALNHPNIVTIFDTGK